MISRPFSRVQNYTLYNNNNNIVKLCTLENRLAIHNIFLSTFIVYS